MSLSRPECDLCKLIILVNIYTQGDLAYRGAAIRNENNVFIESLKRLLLELHLSFHYSSFLPSFKGENTRKYIK